MTVVRRLWAIVRRNLAWKIVALLAATAFWVAINGSEPNADRYLRLVVRPFGLSPSLMVATDRARISLLALACGITVELGVLAAVVLGYGVELSGLAHIALFATWLAINLAGARDADREAAAWPPPASAPAAAPS